ncbi:MAG: pantoate--beta-alanine ligase [Thermoflavifilum sp.]|nr:pantoate--beta-alanine ligase [Thermoflavifilum sp.]
MNVVYTREALQAELQKYRAQQQSIGFVPTMGALHDGHLALVDATRRQASCTVVSIFVNPVQFNDPQDYALYPRTIEADLQLLDAHQADLVFIPEVQEIYPQGTAHLETYALGTLETVLEGAYRPGHFQGVARVMRRLLELVQPDVLVMGEKDYQQCLIIQRLLQLMGLSPRFYMHPTVRETDGLAMSSRNRRLSDTDRRKATLIYESLMYISSQWRNMPFERLQAVVSEQLQAAGFVIDYVVIARSADLQILHAPEDTQMRALIAATLSGVRLIDNMVINP